MAIESFRQLILDAQAMMDPDFAGKLSADVAPERNPTKTPTRISTSAQPTADSASTESATSFDFGGNETQPPLLDASQLLALRRSIQAALSEERRGGPSLDFGTGETNNAQP